MKLASIILVVLLGAVESAIATSYIGLERQERIKGIRYYQEILESSGSYVHSLAKRAADQYVRAGDKHGALSDGLQINAFNRTFNISFEPRQQVRRVLASDFVAYSYSADGTRVPVNLIADDYRTGHVQGEPNSLVLVVFNNGRLESATIVIGTQTYYIDRDGPRHGNESSLIMYRVEDVVLDSVLDSLDTASPMHVPGKGNSGHKMCDSESLLPGNSRAQPKNETSATDAEHNLFRSKRQASGQRPRNTCPLLLVADHKYCALVAGGADKVNSAEAQKAIANKMANMIGRIDMSYRMSDFNGLTQYGFVIKRIELHCQPSVDDSPDSGMPFNIAKDYSHGSLLDAFSQSVRLEIGSYCLAHLFTARTFGGVLGLAYIAPGDSYGAGGICSYSGGNQWYNSGWSTHVGTDGKPMMSLQSEVVTAHELGHNWGSQHDPETDQCAPASGHFLMYPYASTGYDESNHKFSPCSLRGIGAALSARSSSCFIEKSESYCGNGVVEPGEQCDAADRGKGGKDDCCDENCKLRAGKQCSDYNSLCCSNCLYATAGRVCRAANPTMCEPEGICSGLHASCNNTAQSKTLDGKPCSDGGKCSGGKCLSFCETNGLTACACTKLEDSCKRCCRKSSSSNCTVFEQASSSTSVLYLAAGTPCTSGFCDANGKCEKVQSSLTARVWTFMTTLTVDSVVVFMRNNIVGTIVVFSLVVWLPVCITICCIERKQHAQWRNQIMNERLNQYTSDAYEEEETETSRMVAPLSSAPKPLPPSKPPPSKNRSKEAEAAESEEPTSSYDPATPYSIVVVGSASGAQSQRMAPVKAPRPSKTANTAASQSKK